MPQVCTICSHSERLKIEAAIIAGTSLRDVAQRFTVSRDAVHRHKHKCLKPAIQAAQPTKEIRKSLRDSEDRCATIDSAGEQDTQSVWNALSEMQWMHKQVRLIYTESREGEAKDNRIALQALGEDRKQTELFSGFLSSTEQGTEKEMEQEWLNLREIIFRALEPFPDARLAVARALLVVAEYGDDHAVASQSS